MEKAAKIAQIGNPVLRGTAKPVVNQINSEILELIDSLIETANVNKGVGIAAPQIFQPYRLFIMTSHPSDRYPHAPTMAPTAIINPRIIDRGGEIVKDWEGCLSVPNVRGLVPRCREIEVEYITHKGKQKQEVLTNFVARIFQHELDHLNGILFIDRVEAESDLYTEAEYQAIIRSPK